jgi:hypothetical protein
MAEGEVTGATVVSYREGDTPVPLPGLAIVGVKLLGLYAIIQALPQLTLLPLLIWDGVTPWSTAWVRLTFALPQVCYLVIGIVLMRKTDWVVTRVARIPAGDEPSLSANEYVQGIAFSLVGVLLMTWGLAGVVGHLSRFAALQAQRGAGNVVADLGVRGAVEPLVELVLGLYLFLRGRGLAALWHRMRYGGVRVREVE